MTIDVSDLETERSLNQFSFAVW